MFKSLTQALVFLSCLGSAVAVASGMQGIDDYNLINTSGLLRLSLDLPVNADRDEPYQQNPTMIYLAAADAMSAGDTQMSSKADKPVFKERWFTANKLHQYLGLGSLAMATVAAVLPKEEDAPHEYFAKGAAIFGGAAVATGLAFHFEDLSLKGGFSNPDNIHAALSTLGALGFLLAVDKAPEGGHAGLGLSGAVLMLGGIKYTW